MASTVSVNRILPDRRLLPVASALGLCVATIYGQTLRHGFISFDDDIYILDNPAVRSGLSWKGFLWSFTYHVANWHPLTWLSHMLDAQLFGIWAGGHHLVNVSLHAVNAALLLRVLVAMTGSLWRSAAVAAIFALHPLRVESVAWAAERKDVLSALFWLLALAGYRRYAQRPTLTRYLAALVPFVLGLAAKPMLVTLPFALLLLDWWPLGRAAPHRASPAPGSRWGRWTLLVEKTPFFALSLLSSLITLRGQTVDVLPTVLPDLPTRCANAVLSYANYLGAFFWPAGLAVLYPYPRAGVAPTVAAAAAAGLALVSLAAIALRKRRPYLPVGWFWFLGTLVPVIGIVQVGGQARSDRYTYLTMTGVAVALVWLSADVAPRRARTRRTAAVAIAVALTALAAVSAAYVRVWRDSLSLYEHTVKVTTGNFLILDNLGLVLMGRGRTEEALRALSEAENVNSRHCNAPYNQGYILVRAQRYAEALAPLTRALRCYELEGRGPAYVADTHFNLGFAYTRLGRYHEAEEHFGAVLRLVPHYTGLDAALRELSALRDARARPTGHPGE